MGVLVTEVKQIGPNGWRLSYQSDLPNPTFYIYQDGLLVDTTKATTRVLSVPAGESLVVEVLDDPAIKPEAAFPGRLTLGWYSVANAASYRIEEYVSSSWVQRKRVVESGRGYYQWKTRWLEDSTVHQFRVVPVGTNGNDGDPLVFSVLMVRHPDPPDVSYSYSAATQTVTIS
jgi:hypothetical protein